MGMGVANLLLNLLIIGLLMTTITYCWMLNRRIKIIQDSKSELSQLLQYFDESTTRASESIIALQSASKKIGENIQARIEKANFLMEDLAFMVEKGNRLANQLEASFAVNRARSRVASDEPKETKNTPEPVTPIMTKNPVMERFSASKNSEKLSTKEKSAASLEAVLDRVIGRSKNSAAPHEDDDASTVRKAPTSGNKTRSKAEQELLEMIRAGIKG